MNRIGNRMTAALNPAIIFEDRFDPVSDLAQTHDLYA